ncbi:MAG: FtsX-like permease family protein [Candidatus Thermoplasmatota archaeon]|nr:FtsX-like permease family protein [Candidatus Thermoplasmatota archaeon]
MRDRKGKLAPLRKRGGDSGARKVQARGFGPLGYILRDTWRNRSRTILAMAGIASLSLLFIMFTSMDRGLEDYFDERDEETSQQSGEDVVVPREDQELWEVKKVMNNWTYLITIICAILMTLVVANTSIITVVERKFELASLRALGISSIQVSSLVIGSISITVIGGLVSGIVLGAVVVPLLDRTNISMVGNGIGLPLTMDLEMIGYVFILGTVSSLIGMIAPLLLINRQSPLEVLRNA